MRLPLELNITLDERVKQSRELGQCICDEMNRYLIKMGIKSDISIDFDTANFRMEKDPYSGEFSLEGRWQNERQQPCGSIVFHADGAFFAEYDVIENHPSRSKWFVEAITAWGRDDVIKVEPRLLERV